MRRLIVVLALIVIALASRVGAQDYNFAAKRWDNPLGRGGWEMRRYEWHVFYASTATAGAEFLHRSTGLSRGLSALTVSLGMGLVPHVVGVTRNRYPFDGRDWAFDLVNRSAPLILWTGTSGKSWQSKTLACTTIIAAYFALAPYASP